MINQTDKELIERLIKGTKLKKVVWEQSSRETEYKTTLGENSVTTDNWDSGIVTYVDLGIWNNKGEQVYSLSAKKGQDDYKELYNLYSTAKSAYLKVDEVVDDILNHLNF